MSRSSSTLHWEGRLIRLSYVPRWSGVIDHIEIRSDDGGPLPISETGYRSHFFGPVEPSLSMAEVERMVLGWLDHDAKGAAWQTWLSTSRQLSLF